ncbi:hypothetical protein QCM80_43465 [Bradyrhizobium sp. SSUT112]|uniref:hypothetical protein n=1 Tax=Bradyrhizobium sp. SSUT112 TaxID=3040604 RepID=UPI00244BC922|nr:hypothetical protein [Bradyrhizobium sp. SSUT112]MDH2357362.1 hypothetical protein [Bradyrhizobium sp. SSUT112]
MNYKFAGVEAPDSSGLRYFKQYIDAEAETFSKAAEAAYARVQDELELKPLGV